MPVNLLSYGDPYGLSDNPLGRAPAPPYDPATATLPDAPTSVVDPLVDWLVSMRAKHQRDQPSIWPVSNRVGTQALGEQSLTMPTPGTLPGRTVAGGLWGQERPLSQQDYDAFQAGSENAYDQLSLLAGGAGAGGAAERVALAARRIRPPGAPRLPATRVMPPEVPEVSPGPPGASPAPAAAPAATVADIGGGQRGMMAVPSLRSMTPADAAVQAATDAHIIPKPGGGFVGAPDWVQTPDDLVRMRADLDAAIAGGVEGRHWYRDSRDFASDVTGTPRFDPLSGTGFGSTGYGSNSGEIPPTAARRMAEGLAVFSPQANPDTNLQFFLQAHNAYNRGEPMPLVRTGEQAKKFNEGMAAKDAAAAAGLPEPDVRQGKKTGPFAWHLSPDRPYGTTGVNDIWHARSFGYKNADGSEFDGSPTQQQHMFMDYETVKAIDRANQNATGGVTDWNAASIQAAPWVANKEAALARQYPGWTPEEVHAEALKSFPGAAEDAKAHMPHEQVPGQSTGLYDLLPADQRDAFSNAATWRDQTTGRDTLTGNLLLQPQMQPAGGVFRNSAGQLEFNSAQVAHPLVDFSPRAKSGDPRDVTPGTKAVLHGTSYVRGLVDAQEGVPWHHIDEREGQKVGEASSMRLRGPRPTHDQLATLQDTAEKHGYFLSDTGDGISLINAKSSEPMVPGGQPSPANGTELKARLKSGLADEINQALPGARIIPGRYQGNYADLSDELALSVKGEGRATTKVLAELEDMKLRAPAMYEKLMDEPGVATKAQKNLDRLTPEMQAARPDYVKMLQIMSSGRLRALLEHVAKKGGAVGLPAALAAFAADRSDQPGS
jgi:hypothetical protein